MTESNAKNFTNFHQESSSNFNTTSSGINGNTNNSSAINSSSSSQQVSINLGGPTHNQNYQNYAEQREQQLRARESIQKPM